MGQKVLDSFLNKEASVETVVEGFVDYTDSFVLGYFSPSLKNVIVENEEGVLVTVMDKSIIPEHYVLIGDIYTSIEKISIVTMPNIVNVVPNKTQFEYSASKDNIKVRSEYISKLGFESYSEAALLLHKHLGDLSVGIEFETVSGLIPNIELLESGLIPLRDGSIAGIEYATIPLKGRNGAQTLVNCISTINTHVKSDDSCALHYHFGGVPRTEEFIVAFWRVIVQFQNELYLMNSPYKCLNWGVKRKNYSRPLPMLQGLSHSKTTSENAAIIINYLLGGVAQYSDYGNDLKNIKNHPQDPENRQKWNITNRYSIVNLIPLIFGNKQTVEFRMSDITTNKSHIYNEVYLLSSLVKFAITNVKSILTNDSYLNNLSLYDLVESVNSRQFKYIRNFIQNKESIVATSVKRNTSVVTGLDVQSSSVSSDLYVTPLKSNPEFEVGFYKEYHSFLKVHNQIRSRQRQDDRIRISTSDRIWDETSTPNIVQDSFSIRSTPRRPDQLVLGRSYLMSDAYLRNTELLKSNLIQSRVMLEKTDTLVRSIIVALRDTLRRLGTGSDLLNTVMENLNGADITSHTLYILMDVLQNSNQAVLREAVVNAQHSLSTLGFRRQGNLYSLNINGQNITVSRSVHSELTNTFERVLHSEFAYLFIYQTYLELLILTNARPVQVINLLRQIGIGSPITRYTTLINDCFQRNSSTPAMIAKLAELGVINTSPQPALPLVYPDYLSMLLIKYAELIYDRGVQLMDNIVVGNNNENILEEDD